MKGVQCYELFGGIALKIHTFSFFFFFQQLNLLFQRVTAYMFFLSPPQSPAPCPPHLTSCKQHTPIILFLCSLQTSLPFPLRLSKFHIPIYTQSAHQSSRHTPSYACMLQDAVLHIPFYGFFSVQIFHAY